MMLCHGANGTPHWGKESEVLCSAVSTLGDFLHHRGSFSVIFTEAGAREMQRAADHSS